MKRIISLILVLMFSLIIVNPAGARVQRTIESLDDGSIKLTSAYKSDNTTGLYLKTNVSTSTIDPSKHQILGFEILEIVKSGSPELIAALHDSTDILDSDSLFAESEAEVNKPVYRVFPAPKKLSNGLTIHQGANTRVIVYYTAR